MDAKSRVTKKILAVLSAVALLAFEGCGSGSAVPATTTTTTTTTTTGSTSIWVAAWGAAPENALPSTEDEGGSEQSFRFLTLPTIDGTQERVHFSNAYGTTPIVIGSARIAVAGTGAAIVASTDKPLTFGGSTSVTIPAGQQVTSDPVNVTYTFGQQLAVSMYVKGTFPALTQHNSQIINSYASAAGAGDTTTDTTGTAFPNSVQEWYLVSGIDVYGSYQGTVALFGSSSVDGHGSNYGNANAYPVPNVAIPGQTNDRPSDWLARDLIAAGYRIGVLNAGAIGDPAGEDAGTAAGTATAGVDRMNRDVIQQAGIKAVVIYFGGIDLRADCKPATDVEASLTNMVGQAQAAWRSRRLRRAGSNSEGSGRLV